MANTHGDARSGSRGFGAYAREIGRPSGGCQALFGFVDVDVWDAHFLVNADLGMPACYVSEMFVEAGAIPPFNKDRTRKIVNVDARIVWWVGEVVFGEVFGVWSWVAFNTLLIENMNGLDFADCETAWRVWDAVLLGVVFGLNCVLG